MSDDTGDKSDDPVHQGEEETFTGDEGFTGEEETLRPTHPDAILARFAEQRDPVIGKEVSGYVVKGKLGTGGMGIVYEGEQPVIGKRVAIKVLRPEIANDPDVVERLVAEARAVNQVGHRGIIDVFGFGRLPDGRHCIVMEYLDGESLEHLISGLKTEHRLMPILEVLNILDELLSALSAAHSAGVVHRDLKPSNIFLCKQRDGTRFVKVLDFGIAKLGVNSAAHSNASLMVGTPAYMAPEQSRGGKVSPALDLYAVGCLAFELLTGQPVFPATSIVEVITKHQSATPPRVSEKVLSLPDLVDDWVFKLLQKAPEDRYPSADEARKVLAPLRKELSKSNAHIPQLTPARGALSVAPLVGAATTAPQAAAPLPTTTVAEKKAPASSNGLVLVLVAALLLLGGGGAYLLTRARPAPANVTELRARLETLRPLVHDDGALKQELFELTTALTNPEASLEQVEARVTALEAKVHAR